MITREQLVDKVKAARLDHAKTRPGSPEEADALERWKAARIELENAPLPVTPPTVAAEEVIADEKVNADGFKRAFEPYQHVVCGLDTITSTRLTQWLAESNTADALLQKALMCQNARIVEQNDKIIELLSLLATSGD
jgi:hypothetical protein